MDVATSRAMMSRHHWKMENLNSVRVIMYIEGRIPFKSANNQPMAALFLKHSQSFSSSTSKSEVETITSNVED